MRTLYVMLIFCVGFRVESMDFIYKKTRDDSFQMETQQWIDIHKCCRYDDVVRCISGLSKKSTTEEKVKAEQEIEDYFVNVRKVIYERQELDQDLRRLLDSEQQGVFLRYLEKCQEIGAEPSKKVISMDM